MVPVTSRLRGSAFRRRMGKVAAPIKERIIVVQTLSLSPSVVRGNWYKYDEEKAEMSSARNVITIVRRCNSVITI